MDGPTQEDPHAWSVDRLVEELCYNDNPTWVRAGLSDIPAKHQLADTLQSNHIDGAALFELSSEELKADLNIKSLGQRKALERVIRFLRGDGAPSATPARFATNRMSGFAVGMPSPFSHESYHDRSPAWDGPYARPPSTLSRSEAGPTASAQFQHPSGLLVGHSPLLAPNTNLQPTPAPPNGHSFTSTPRDSAAPAVKPSIEKPDEMPSKYRTLSPKKEPDAGSELLDNLEAAVNENLQPTVSQQDEEAAESDASEKPGQVKPKEKRRIAPTLVGPVKKSSGSATQDDIPDQRYLGRQVIPIQDTFYNDLSDEEKDFKLIGQNEQPGLSLTLARRIRRSLLSSPISVPNLSYDALAKIYYLAQHCADPSSTVYFTLFAENAPPSIQALKDWPNLLGCSQSQIKTKHLVDRVASFTKEEIAIARQQTRETSAESDLGEFAYLLDKYPVGKEDSDLLPTYGDSGDENEYDEETWAEINAEKEEEHRSASAFLSREQKQAALEKALDEIKQKWCSGKLPKVQLKAYRLWMRVARTRKRQNDVDSNYAIRSRKTAYLGKLKDQIIRDTWRSADQIKQQCEALEETVHQILEADHFLGVLHQNTPPEKPALQKTRRKPPEKPQIPEDEEILQSDSEPESAFEPDMNDFILDDDNDVAMVNDQADPDFNPIIPRGLRQPTTAVHVDDSSTGATTAGAQDEQLSIAKSLSPGLMPSSPPAVDTPPSVAESPADDADAESDANEEVFLSSVTKRQDSKFASPRKAVKQKNWPSSPKQDPPKSDDDDNSDFDAPSRLPNSKYKSRGTTREAAIELLSSDHPQPAEDSTGDSYEVATPPLNSEEPDGDGVAGPSTERTLKLRFTRRPTDEPRSTSEQDTVDDVRRMRIAALETALSHCTDDERSSVWKLVQKSKPPEPGKKAKLFSVLLHDGLAAMHHDPNDPSSVRTFHINGLPRGELEATEMLTHLFVCYANARNFGTGFDYHVGALNLAFDRHQAYAATFETDIVTSLNLYDKTPRDRSRRSVLGRRSARIEMEPSSGKHKRGTKRKHEMFADSDVVDSGFDDSDNLELESDLEPQERNTPHSSKKKRKITVSKEVRDTQKDDQARVKEQESRREKLVLKMRDFDTDSTARHPVNSQEPVVWLTNHIATKVKPHQVHGIQFLWREIVEDPRHQGCLLAHTMGLGKTMQVISLLVTIAECRLSFDAAIVDQIPKHLRSNRTLVLCPPSLIDNWYDELLMWTPPDDQQLLGTVVKIGSGRTPESFAQMKHWASSAQGGVLIISYDTFRSLLLPSAKGSQVHKEQVPQYEKWLLELPSLVVADEAHKLKNAASKISMVAKRFKTMSRIALTGSPLNNHLEEYHTMVEWISPNYLGDLAQFRSKYIEPITAGLYADSTATERRTCLRKLHVLKKDLAPKVNRADITAIRKDMPPKTEYIITIPLAKEQQQAYDLYVMALLKRHENKGRGTSRRNLFAWLNKMIVLANHPSCFVRLYEKYEDMLEIQKPEESSTDNDERPGVLKELDENYDPLNVDKVSNFDIESMRGAVAVFDGFRKMSSSEDPLLSYRTLMAMKILQKAQSIGEKTLVFSQSIPTLDYLERMLQHIDPNVMRIDGATKITKRQEMTKEFNKAHGKDEAKIILISTKAGGLGLNLQGASRVIIFDSGFNPMWEEQAVGRAYRLGQTSAVHVYRFKCGGTFEEPIYNKALFKTQLFQRVVDKKNPTRAAEKAVSDYLFPSKPIKRQDYSNCLGRDPGVLDEVLKEVDFVFNLELTETFQKDDGEELNEEELKLANNEYEDERLRRENPAAWQAKNMPGLPGGLAGAPPGSQPGTAGTAKTQAAGGGNKGGSGRRSPSDTVAATHGTQWVDGQVANLGSSDPGVALQTKKGLIRRFAHDPYGLQAPGRAFRKLPAQVYPAISVSGSDSEGVNIDQISSPKEDSGTTEGCKPQ
ncbi:uncharacterized protein HMPREF1541_04928 [Cyphellophora europaea CBS 101466]|uniref:Uncharacterized protein n=1 Tax=Cyphellophora europaea (strain CBS 101466) TaxID=1220924 RepID=W2RY92_CYPE1|nr:uncharacterized protein HMPREF1541_04928 [Cyphellophora europaea CBS 101466]ETN40649.1 hypothetical protein HMPREF1541_04928 [Cyphellophora europaea CBS 101466]